MASLSNLKPASAFTANYHPKCSKTIPSKIKWGVVRASSAAPGVDLNTLQSAIAKVT